MVEYADYQLFIHSVIFIVLFLCFNVCVMIPSGQMTSIVLSILERDPPLELFLIRCEVKGQGCLCVQILKHSEAYW